MLLMFETVTYQAPKSQEQWQKLTAAAPRGRYPWTTREEGDLLKCRHSEDVGEFAMREGRTFQAIYSRWRTAVRGGQAMSEPAPWIELERSPAPLTASGQ